MERTPAASSVAVILDRDDGDPGRLAAVASQIPGTPDTVSVSIVAGETWPDLRRFGAAVVDGRLLSHPGSRAVADWVGSGGSLVVLGLGLGGSPRAVAPTEELLSTSGLLGIGSVLPTAEWFATVVAPAHPVTERADGEFVVHGSFVPLEPTVGTRSLLTVSVGFRNLCAMAEHRLGDGRVVTCGLDEQGCEPSELARILGRALRRVDDEHLDRPPVGVAIVGYGAHGGMGYSHGIALEATQGLELVAVCESDPGRRKEAAHHFPGVRTYGDLHDVIADADVELVVVATPPVSHAEIGIRLLREGRHVVMEKPLCFTVAEADELASIASANDVVLTVHQNRRWDRDFRAVRRAVESGALGEVFNIETFVGGFDHPCRAWHSDAVVSGGAAYDWGSHYLDWMVLLLGGPPSRVSSTGHKRVWRDVTNLDQERVHLWWEDGREAEFVHSDVAAIRRPKFYVQGTSGTLEGTYRDVTFERIEAGRGFVSEPAHHAEAPADLRMVTYAGSGLLVESALPPAPDERFRFHRNLADHVRDGVPLAVPVASVRPVVAILEAAAKSSSQGGATVDLPDFGAAPTGRTTTSGC